MLVLLIKNEAEGRQAAETNAQRKSLKVVNKWKRSTNTREVISLRKLGPEDACKRRSCCLRQIKWGLFLAASSYPQSQCLWHCAFRQGLSVGFILFLIYSFKQWQPYSKTMAHKLGVELTSIIMQFWGKKSPIVTLLLKFLPPPVLDIQVNKLFYPGKYSDFPS